jgi:hypothetical protein
MDKIRQKKLLWQVAEARKNIIEVVSGLTPMQAHFKSSGETWSIAENIEHLVLAEKIGINGMWKAFEGIKLDKPVWIGEPIHHGLSIEEIVERTWPQKVEAPELVRPKWGGPIEFWIASLVNCQPVLEALLLALAGFDLDKIIYPHPISGPLNIWQRLEFLRFHLNRHQGQVENIKSNPGFPKLRKVI